MTFEYGQALWLLALLPLLAVLLLLPLRKRLVRVASLPMWERVFEANPVHRYSRWLRVLVTIALEAVILILVALAAARVQAAGTGIPAARRIVIIDRSADMQVLEDGASRFTEARRILKNLIAAKGPQDQIMIISALPRPEITSSWTTDARSLLRTADTLACTDATADLKAALELAVHAADQKTVICLISSSTSGLESLPPPANPVLFYPCGKDGQHENVGITAFDVQRRGPGKNEFHVFLRVSSNADRPIGLPLEITLNEQRLGQTDLTIPANSTLEKEFVYASERGGRVMARLSCQDALAVDNQAFGVLPDACTGKVYLWSAAPDPFLMYAVAIHRNLEFLEINKDKVGQVSRFGNAGDIFIFNRAVPANLPELSNLIMIDPPSTTALLPVRGRVKLSGESVRAVADHPLFAGIDWRNLVVNEAAQITPPHWAQTLLSSAEGVPLILAGMQNGRKVVVFTFNPAATTLVTDAAYPILLSNILAWLGTAPVRTTLSCGQAIDLPAGQPETVSLPAGGQVSVPAGRSRFADTENAGFYEVHDAISPAEFGVSLLNEPQTLMRQAVSPPWLQQAAVPAARARSQSVWWALAMVTLALLLGEWFLYHYRYIE